MGKLKVTLVRKPSQLTKLKATGYSIILGRNLRNELLQESDWVTSRSNETGQPIPDDWKTYRQALRDLPTHKNWPDLQESDWPTKPK